MGDQKSAYDVFMSSTGFGKSSLAAQPVTVPPAKIANARDAIEPLDEQSQRMNLLKQYAYAAPKAPVPAPGMTASVPYTAGYETPMQGLVPGHMPLVDSLDKSVKTRPYPMADRFDKPPFLRAGNTEKVQDWRSVGVGRVTDRNSPGLIPSDPPFGYLNGFRSHVESAVATWSKEKISKALFALSVVSFLFLGFLAHHRTEGFTAPNALALVGASTSIVFVLVLYNNPVESQSGAFPTGEMRDVGRTNQRYRPLMRHEGQHEPFPYHPNQPSTTMDQMRLQNTDMDNMEGPRANYGYKRGPTPGDQRRLQESQLMRSAALYNMDEAAFAEYMARLEGEAPDQFYQAHPYLPFSAHWDHKQSIADTDEIHGISTHPGQALRKSKYIDPRIQQAGAKTSHLKDPPPGSEQPIERVHPWMEKPLVTEQLQADDSRQDIEREVAMAREKEQTFGPDVANLVVELAKQREADDRVINANLGVDMEQKERELPAALQPIPTTQAGYLELQKEKQRQMTQQNGASAKIYNAPDQAGVPATMRYDSQDHLVTPEAKAKMEFGSAFTPNTLSASAIEAALQEKPTR